MPEYEAFNISASSYAPASLSTVGLYRQNCSNSRGCAIKAIIKGIERGYPPHRRGGKLGSKGLKFYEDLLQTIKPHKIPLIEEFEMEDIRGPESKPPTVRPGKIAQKLQDYEAEDYEPEGLEGEILMAYGPTPPLKILLRLLTEHGNQAHAFGRGIFVSSSDGKKIIPATLRAVMEYLGY